MFLNWINSIWQNWVLLRLKWVYNYRWGLVSDFQNGKNFWNRTTCSPAKWKLRQLVSAMATFWNFQIMLDSTLLPKYEQWYVQQFWTIFLFLRMSKYDAEVYEKFSSQVRKQVQALRLIISGLQAKAKDRQWLKNQTMGNCLVFDL